MCRLILGLFRRSSETLIELSYYFLATEPRMGRFDGRRGEEFSRERMSVCPIKVWVRASCFIREVLKYGAGVSPFSGGPLFRARFDASTLHFPIFYVSIVMFLEGCLFPWYPMC